MFKLMDKKIIAILRKLFLIYYIYVKKLICPFTCQQNNISSGCLSVILCAVNKSAYYHVTSTMAKA